MRNQRSLVIAAGIAALLIPASAAQAATKQVTIGPAKPLQGVQLAGFDADFYPRKITIGLAFYGRGWQGVLDGLPAHGRRTASPQTAPLT